MTSEVVTFPTPEEEQARRLLALIKQRASQPEAERRLWLPGDTQKFGIEEARLWELYEAEVREREKHQREELAVQREAERKAERKAEQSQRKAERKQKQEEREQEREERREEQEERRERREKAAERREAAKRERALTTIMTMPTDGRDAALRSLAIQLGEDYAALHTEFETRVEEERERIRHGKVEPWPEPVETRALLDELVVQIERYLVLPHPEARAAMVLWICFAWVHDIATFSPILALTSADADAGKSTASQIIAKLTPRPHLLSEPSAASVYHIVDDEQPTLIVDDADRLLARFPNLAHIVNTAWQRGAKVSRYDSRARRNIYYDVFYPKVLNGIDLLLHLRPATRTRCITINLKPKLPTEKVTSFRFADNDEQFVTLQRKLRRWSKDNKATLKQANPAMPKGYGAKFTNRLEENFVLLFAIADLAGAKWGKQARDAAVKLTPIEPLTDKRRLLADIGRLFVEHGVKARQQLVLVSDQVPALLAADVNSEWADYRGHGPINQFKVAHLLKTFGPLGFGIRTHQMWLNGKNVNVYRYQDFEDDFKRHLPPDLQPKPK